MTEPSPSIDEVRAFWEANPLWSGESALAPGSREFFEEHRRIVIADCFAGQLDPRTLPAPGQRGAVLDLGCGPGFWTVEFARLGCRHLVAADLTEQALALCRERCRLFGVVAEFSRQNAESLTFADGTFDHVNCQGVIHHTPDTPACVREIARVLKPGGTASLSVYYRHVVLRSWPVLRVAGRAMAKVGIGLSGRGRERLLAVDSAEDLVRLYDGAANPIGRAYSRRQFESMLGPHFETMETYLHYFPMRVLPVRVPRVVHRVMDRHFGFMIFATVRKAA